MIKQTLDMIVHYWQLIAFMGAIVGALWRWLVKRDKRQGAEMKALSVGLQAMLRQAIIDNHTKYTEREYITIHGLEHAEKLYTAYSALGGNSFVCELMSDLRALQVKGSATK